MTKFKKQFLYLLLCIVLLENSISCLDNYQYAKSWKWKSNTSSQANKFNEYKFYGTFVAYADLPSGMEIKDNATVWSIEISEDFTYSSNKVCFGLYDIDNYSDTTGTGSFLSKSISACTDDSLYENLGSSAFIKIPFPYDKKYKGKYDMILNDQNKFIITNENYGRDTRIEFDIDPSKKYFPFVEYYTPNSSYPGYIRINACSDKCQNCDDWVLDQCTSCKYISNVEDAPSCNCKPGFTHYYNNQSNSDCQAEPNYYVPSAQEYIWQSTETPEPDNIHLGQYEYDTGTSTYIQHWVDLPNGIQVQQEGIKWTIQITENKYNHNNPDICFGFIDKVELGTPESSTSNKNSYSNSICTASTSVYEKNSTKTVNGKMQAYGYALVGMKFDIIFTSTQVTITNIPYYGTTDVVFDYDNSKEYVPYIQFYEYQGSVRVAACSPRCIGCKYFEPEICLACNNPSKRNSVPDCSCQDGTQDSFIIPNINKVQPVCINDYVYYEISPIDWKWISYSSQQEEIRGGVFRTVSGYAKFIVDLGNQGIQYLNDGTKWTVKIKKHDFDQSYICFGVQQTNYLHDYQSSSYWTNSSRSGAIICTDGNFYNHSSYSKIQVGDQFPEYKDSEGKTFDLYYFPSLLVITDTAYGGNVRYEFELNEYLSYLPHIMTYSATVLRKPTFQVWQCSKRCATCKKFDPDVCIACNDSANRSSAPSCLCKAGLEDFYFGKLQETCRQIPTWKKPSPPEWIWYTESTTIFEDIDIGENKYNFGTFRQESNSNSSIRVKGFPTIENYTQWTVRIKQHDSTSSKVCMGIINQSKADIAWSSSGQYSSTISQCSTGESDKYDSDNFGTEYHSGQLVDKFMQTGQIYDLFYERHSLKISNINYGGNFERVFPLNELTNYTPIVYMYSPLTVIQVKGCSTRCRNCVDFDPNNCLSCGTIDNRNTAPTCTCQANFDDIFGGQMQDQCRPSEYYNSKSPPEWIWVFNGYQSYDYATEDIDDQKENYGTFRINDDNVGFHVKSIPVLEDYTSWTVKILEHNQDGKMCFGVVEAQQFLSMSRTSYQPTYMSCFSTDNKLYNKFGTTNGQTNILYDMPIYSRESLNGEAFDILYKRDMLTITNENYNGQFGGRKIKAEIKLDPGLTYMPFIATSGSGQKIQFKGCSKRCLKCIDWQPKQCLICNDQVNRNMAPCCECKYGFIDLYNSKINEICQTKKSYEVVKFPEWEWTNYQSSNCGIQCGEFKDKRGVFATKQDYDMNLYLDDKKHLQTPTQWRVKIINHTENGKMCFGVRHLKQDVDYYNINYSVTACTDNQEYNNDAISKVTYSDFPTDRRENNGSIIDIIFEPDYLQVINNGDSGGINAEFKLDPYVKYTPFVQIKGISEEVQFLHCNKKCKTCKDWFPDECYQCKGENRVGLPTCGCKEGFTDYYRYEYLENCIPIVQYTEEHPHPSDWVYKTSNDNIIDMGNGIFKNSSNGGMIYVDLGKEGIQHRKGGTKWSIQIQDMQHSSNVFCIGLASIDKMRKYSISKSHVFQCLYNNNNGYYDSESSSNVKYNDNYSYSFEEFIGKRFDVFYDQGYARITDRPYGGFKDYEWKLYENINFVPMIYINSSSSSDNIINTRPCHYKCESCDSTISTKQCDVCADTLTRDPIPDCACKPGFYENPEGYYKCLECKAPCQSCINDTVCLTCLSQPNRKNNAPDCDCELGYYNTINNECKACHYKCQDCQESSETCTKCKAEPNRNQTSCECIEGYYESAETKSCAKCPNSCKTCADGSGICLICACDRKASDGQGGICTCPPNSYGLSTGDEGQCQLCKPPCATCSSETVCNTCTIVGAHRQPSPSCKCEQSYYEDEFKNCRACMKGCLICEKFAYRCNQCIIDPNRSQDVNSCECLEGYIESPATGMCVEDICMEKCAICVPGDSTLCYTCADTPNRKSISNNCDCVDGYYDNGTIECQKCPYPCEQCSSPSNCITCITTLNRNYPPSCTCIQGSYEDSGKNCAPCSHQCRACTGDANNCTLCILEANRSNTGQCGCLPGYIENSATKKCQIMTQCASKCDTCLQNNLQSCTACTNNINSNRKGVDDNCECKDMYFEVDQEECKACVYPCTTCQNLSYCIECALTGENRQEAPNCTCYEGYIEDEDKNCILSATGCPREEGRSTDGNCVCIEGYFENEQGVCQVCKEGCAQCVNGTGCLRCADGYKQDSLPDCIICDLVCADCGSSPSECIRCAEGRHEPPECPCQPQHFEDGQNPQCHKCEEQCESCDVKISNCIKCKGSISKRYEAPNCKCWEGYYENSDNNNDCEACDYKCLTCEGTSDNCLICRPGIDRILTAPSCNCKFGTYSTPYNNNCEFCSTECQASSNKRLLFTEIIEQPNLKCNSKCKSCDMFSMECLVCLPGKNTTMVPPKCQCLKGYYQDQDSQECYRCKEECEECTSEYTCSTCKFENMMINFTGQCVCKEGFIQDQITKQCQQCYYYQGECYIQCPQGTQTIKDQEKLCFSIEFKEQYLEIIEQNQFTEVAQIYGYIIFTIIVLILVFKKIFIK